MILFTILTIMLAILAIVSIVLLGTGGAILTIFSADLIVCMFIIACIIGFVKKNKKK